MTPPHANSRIVLRIAWLAAGLLFVMGAIAAVRTGIQHRRRVTEMRQSIEQLAELDDLAARAAAARARMDLWAGTGARPPVWRVLLREGGQENTVEIRESEQAMAAEGWQLRRADLSAPAIKPEDLGRLLERAQAAAHPWRLREIDFQSGPAAPATLNAVRMRFETPVPTAR